MLENFSLKITYMADGEERTVSGDTENFSLVVNGTPNKLLVNMLPLINEVELVKATVTINYDFQKNDKIFVNGYQSSSLSKEYDISDKVVFDNKSGSLSGDMMLSEDDKKGNSFISYTYGYIRNGREIELFGSVSEACGFTIIKFKPKENKIEIVKDIEGSVITNMITLFDLVYVKSDIENAFNKYFEKTELKPPKMKSLLYYSVLKPSGYNEAYALSNIEIFKNLKTKADMVLLGDGHQFKTGDWLSYATKFPSGYRKFVDKVHNLGMLAGIWLAPFACAPDSEIAVQHPQWLIKDDSNNPIICYSNGKAYYTMDYYNPKVQVYINGVISKIFDEWDFDAIKIDNLYPQCIYPRYDQNRGQIMYDALTFLREISDDKLIIAGEVPLGAAFGNVDVCSVCCDFGEEWEDDFKLDFPEQTNSASAIESMIFRRQLNGRAFLSCSGLIPLGANNKKYKQNNKELMLKIAQMTTGGKIIVDDFAEVKKKEKDFFSLITQENNSHIDFVELAKKTGVLEIEYTENAEKKDADIDLKNGKM